jgi:hypothetical protein
MQREKITVKSTGSSTMNSITELDMARIRCLNNDLKQAMDDIK